jgi:hypothetical protein
MKKNLRSRLLSRIKGLVIVGYCHGLLSSKAITKIFDAIPGLRKA